MVCGLFHESRLCSAALDPWLCGFYVFHSFFPQYHSAATSRFGVGRQVTRKFWGVDERYLSFLSCFCVSRYGLRDYGNCDSWYGVLCHL